MKKIILSWNFQKTNFLFLKNKDYSLNKLFYAFILKYPIYLGIYITKYI